MKYYGKNPKVYQPKIKKDGKEYTLPTYYFRLPAKVDPTRKQMNTGRTNKREAEMERDSILDQLVSRSNEQVYEEAYLDKAIEPYLEYKRNRLGKGRSFQRYEQVINEFLGNMIGQFGKVPMLSNIKLMNAEKYFNWIIAEAPTGRGTKIGQSEKSHNCKKAIVSNLFKYCVKHGWLARNFISDIPDLEEKELDIIPYTKEEANIIMTYLKNEKNTMRKNKCYYEIICIVFMGGTRISEPTHLIGGDLDFITHTIKIRNKIIRGLHIFNKKTKETTIELEYKTKTGRNWLAPMNDVLEPILKKWVKDHNIKEQDLLFPNTNGNPIKNDLIANEIKKILIKLNFPPDKISRPLHRGRHAFCSHATEAGVKEPAIQAALGHKSNAMTKKYQHLSPDYIGKEFNKLSYRQKGKEGVK